MGRPAELVEWGEAQLQECQRIALRYFQRRLRVERKADRSPVTAADRAIEELLRRRIGRAFPHDAIVGEEFGGTALAGGSYWTIDPIDGTRAFSRGLPSWGMLLGRVERGRAIMGACSYPAIDTFIGAAHGVGAYERVGSRRRRLPRAKAVRAIDESVIFHGGARWWLTTPYARGLGHLVQDCYLERAYGDCYAYLWVLRGHADAMIEYGVKVWDMAPFAAFADATGHALTDFRGRSSFVGPDSLFAHPTLVRKIASYLKPHRS